MLLRVGILLAASLFLGLFSCPPVAKPLGEATENPFVARQSPLETRLAECRAALRLSPDQDRLFVAFTDQLRQARQEHDAEVVAAAIDRNRARRMPHDPGDVLRARADRLTRQAERLRRLADLESSFFASLSQEQQRIAAQGLGPDLFGLNGGSRRRGPRMDRKS
jgi:hypothetical protein